MGVEEKLRSSIEAVLGELVGAGTLSAEAVRDLAFSVERPKRAEHGDLATNVALALAKRAGRPPRELATAIADRLRQAGAVRDAEVAGPGFLNVRFAPSAYQEVAGEILSAGSNYGRAPAASGERVHIEFVSANPTGPLLISHGRGAVAGDALARLLEANGHRVTREYYINDYGNQIRLLAASIRASARGEPPPEGGYGGAYVKELADSMKEHAPELLEASSSEIDDPLARLAVLRMLDGVPGSKELGGIRQTLRDLGIEFDVWYSEESLHRWGRVSAALQQLERTGWLEEREGALFFKSSDVQDDKDRVVRRSDGRFTYFASDIAYHADKIARGYDRLINVLGADHHGYVARVRNALEALGLQKDRFEVLLFQLVSLLRDGKPYKMGKRLGNLITIDEIVEEIDVAAGRKGAGADALRYYYLVRRTESPIELDIELAKKRSLDNPVFYLQYGHARLVSILRRAKDVFGLEVPRYSAALVSRLVHPDELSILGHLGTFPRVMRAAAEERAPHQVLFFLQELAQSFQSYYTRLKNEKDAILPQASQLTPGWQERWDREKTEARLLWVEAIRTVYAAGLSLLGISAPDRMVRPSEADGEKDEDGDVLTDLPTKESQT
ncbi:MAG TPA: arginine--tRNA ligase [Polyangiaceae bacterium]